MAKVNLSNPTSLQNESSVVTLITANNVAITAAMENTLSRDGTSPNPMKADLDMDSNRIINLPDATGDQEPTTFGQFTQGIQAVGGGAVIQGTYVTLGNNPLLQNERVLTGSSNISVVDNGPNATVVIDVADPELRALATTVSDTDQLPYFTGPNSADTTDFTAYARTLLDDVDDVAARATLAAQKHDNTLDVLSAYDSNGILTQTASDTFVARTVTGTANEISVTNGNGVSGNPTVSLPAAITLTGKTITGGSYPLLTASSAVATDASKNLVSVTNTGTGLNVLQSNPTLIAPSISSSGGSFIGSTSGTTVLKGSAIGAGTLTLPTGLTDTIVTKTSTDVLTNKSISGATNTVTALPNSALTNSTITVGTTSTALGGTLAAAVGRSSAGLNIDSATGHGDSNYTILATDRHVFTNANFTAARSWTLPAANAVNPGQRILIGDLQGTVTATNMLLINRAGSDTINGGTGVTLASANASLEVVSDGVSQWYAVQAGGGGGGGGGGPSSPMGQYEYVATAAQTTFFGADQNGKSLLYTPGNIEVFLNGIRLNKSDYSATNGANVVLSLAVNAGDMVTIVDHGGGGAASFTRFEYTATASQTTFSGADLLGKTLAYVPGYVVVTVNGSTLATTDYTATSGTSIVFGVGRAVNDQVSIVSMNQSAIALIPTNNLSDVTSVPTALTNLGITSVGTAAVGHVPGIASNAAAIAGEVGELKASNGTTAVLTSGVPMNAASIVLTAGDWDVSASAVFNAGGTTSSTDWQACVSSATGSLTALTGSINCHERTIAMADHGTQMQVLPFQVLVTSSTTVFLNLQGNFTGTQPTVTYVFRARRMR